MVVKEQEERMDEVEEDEDEVTEVFYSEYTTLLQVKQP